MKCNLSLNAFVLAIIIISITPAVKAAPNDLMVEFQSTPLFSEANFLPGNSITRWVKVINNRPSSKRIITEAINEQDSSLSDALAITIRENENLLYSASLAQFFSAGEIVLSTIAGNGGKTQYDFTVAFPESSNNSYQEKNVGFDILIGFQGEESHGDVGASSTPTNEVTADGGGGIGNFAQGLTIHNEAEAEPNEITVHISWLTSYKSTSRVVYGSTPGIFNFTLPPNYGYSFSTDEHDTPANPNGVTFHQITLTSLLPGTTYYYRTISHASPDTISVERSFVTKSPSIPPFSPFQSVTMQNARVAPPPQPSQIPAAFPLQENIKIIKETIAAAPSSLPVKADEPVKSDLAENINLSAPFSAFVGTSFLKKNIWIFFIIVFLAALAFLWRTKK